MLRTCLLGLFMLAVSTQGEISRTIPGCMTSELDVVFLIDSSEDVSTKQLAQTKEFIEHTISHFDISPLTTRTSVVMYGSTPKVLNYLENITHTSPEGFSFGRDGVLQLLESATPVRGSRRTGKALNYACDVILGFKSEVPVSIIRRRPWVPKVIIVVATGYSQDDISSDLSCRPDTRDEEVADHDVTIIGISITSRGVAIFRNKHVDSVIYSDSAAFLVAQQDDLLTLICESAAWGLAFAEQELVFVIDRSSSVDEDDVRFILAFLKNMVERFSISSEATRVSLIWVSDVVKVEFELNEHMDLDSVLQAIESIPLTSSLSASSQTNVDLALRYVANSTFRNIQATEPRNNIRRTLVVVTDGYSADRDEVESAARDLHLGGVEIYTVGIGRVVSEAEMRVMATRPYWSHITTLQYYYLLPRFSRVILNKMRYSLFEMYHGALLDVQFLVQYMTGESDGISDYGVGEAEVKAWLKRIVDMYHVGSAYARFGLAMFGGNAKFSFSLSENRIKDEVLKGIEQTQFISDHNYVYWGDVLENAVRELENNSRRDTGKVLIILSHTRPSEEIWSYIKTLHAAGIGVFWFGLSAGRLSWQYGDSMSGSWHLVPRERGYAALSGTVPNVVEYVSKGSVQGCEGVEVDLQFLLDGSGSIGEDNFEKVKDWVSALVSTFDVGPYATRVGVNEYSDDADPIFKLNEYWKKSSVVNAVEKIPYLKQGTRTGSAINFTTSESLVPEGGTRNGVQKILVVLTDGESDDSVVEASERAHGMKDLTTYAIGVGDADEAELHTIASSSAHVFQADDFDSISAIKRKLADAMCKTVVKDEPFACKEGEADLIILVDDSTYPSGSGEFRAIQNFIKSLSRGFSIRPDGMRFVVIQFASKPRVTVPYSANADSTSLNDAISSLEKLPEPSNYRPGANLGAALDYARQILGTRGEQRIGVKKTVLAIMANPSDDSASSAATDLAASGVGIFGINIGPTASQTQLENIVTGSQGENFMTVPDASALEQLGAFFNRRLCQTSLTDCMDKSMDLVLVVENAGSMDASNFESVMRLLSSVAAGLDVGPDGVHLSMVLNSRNAFGDLNELQDFTNVDNVPLSLSSITVDAGATKLKEALVFARDFAFPKSYGNRHVRKVVLMVTDGEGLLDVKRVADDVRLFEEEIGLLKVGVGEIMSDDAYYTDYYDDVASNGKDQIVAASYDDLSSIRSKIIRTLCRDAQCPALYRDDKSRRGKCGVGTRTHVQTSLVA